MLLVQFRINLEDHFGHDTFQFHYYLAFHV
jgi:hypothetical protein